MKAAHDSVIALQIITSRWFGKVTTCFPLTGYTSAMLEHMFIKFFTLPYCNIE